MLSSWSIVLGLGLVILGLAGLSGDVPGLWMAWLDFFVALGSFVIAGTNNRAGTLAISAILFLGWIVGLATSSVAPSLVWWNFAFASAFGLIGILSRPRGEAIRPSEEYDRDHEHDRDHEKPRRVA